MDAKKAIAYTRKEVIQAELHPAARAMGTAILDAVEATIEGLTGDPLVQALTAIGSVMSNLQGALMATAPHATEHIAMQLGQRLAESVVDTFNEVRDLQ